MKNKILSLSLVFILIIALFGLTGCNNDKEDTSDTKKEKTPETLATEVVEKFYSLANEKKVDEMFDLIDFLGMYTLMSLDEDKYDTFDSEYSSQKESDDWKKTEVMLEESLKETKSSLKEDLDDGMESTTVAKTEVEKIGDNFFKVTAEIEVEDEDGKKSSETLDHYVYNTGKEYKIVYAEGL